jgi:hypothetical protein
MGELLDALNGMDDGPAPPARQRKSVIDQAAEAVDKAIEACREPGMSLYTLTRWTRQSPLQALAIAFLGRRARNASAVNHLFVWVDVHATGSAVHPSHCRPTGQSANVSLSDDACDLGADLRSLRLRTGVDPGFVAVHDPFNRVPRRSSARALGRAAGDHAARVGWGDLDSDRLCDRLAAADHLGAIPSLAIATRTSN